MKVAVVIVNYGTAKLAAEAVDSVLRFHDNAYDCEIHLVDNASPEGDAVQLAEIAEARGWGQQVTLWPEKNNHGFGRGNNVVLRELSNRQEDDVPDFVFLLNPDAALVTDALQELMTALIETPEAAAAGAAVRNADGSLATAAFRFPSVVSELARVVDFGPLSRLTYNFRVALALPVPRTTVDWVTGAAVIFRLEAVKDVDFFDSGFFLYYEEVDLMRRLGDAGWKVLHVPEAEVMHRAGVSTGVGREDGVRRRNPPYLYNSWAHYFHKSLGRPSALVLAFLLFPAGALNVLIFLMRGRHPSLPKKFFRDHWRYAVRSLIKGDTTA